MHNNKDIFYKSLKCRLSCWRSRYLSVAVPSPNCRDSLAGHCQGCTGSLLCWSLWGLHLLRCPSLVVSTDDIKSLNSIGWSFKESSSFCKTRHKILPEILIPLKLIIRLLQTTSPIVQLILIKYSNFNIFFRFSTAMGMQRD